MTKEKKVKYLLITFVICLFFFLIFPAILDMLGPDSQATADDAGISMFFGMWSSIASFICLLVVLCRRENQSEEEKEEEAES